MNIHSLKKVTKLVVPTASLLIMFWGCGDSTNLNNSHAKKDASISAPSAKDIISKSELDSDALYSIMNLMEIHFHKYELSSKFKDYQCDFLTYEFKKGKIVDSTSLLKDVARNNLRLKVSDGLKNNIFPIEYYDQKVNESMLKMHVSLGTGGLTMKFHLDPKEYYSWKSVYDPLMSMHVVEPEIFYPLLAYTTAVSDSISNHKGAVEFCQISGESIPFTNWYKALGIKHYFITGIRLVK